MLQRAVRLATVVFWSSVPLLGTAMILPWLRIDWLLVALAVPVAASAAVLTVLTSSPGYVSPASLSKDVERVVYALAFVYAMGTIAYYGS
jgi:hypothetical protein